MTITKQFRSSDPVVLERIYKKIDEMLAEALAELKDPQAYAVRQMFNKLKKTHPLNKPKKYLYNADTKLFDQEPWDNDD